MSSSSYARFTMSFCQKQRRLSQQLSQTRTLRSHLTFSKKEHQDWRDNALRLIFFIKLRKDVASSHRYKLTNSLNSNAKSNCFV